MYIIYVYMYTYILPKANYIYYHMDKLDDIDKYLILSLPNT